MIIQLCIYLVVLLIGFYYFTAFLHFIGFNVFRRKDVRFGRALIPFYYWGSGKSGPAPKKRPVTFEEKVKAAEQAVADAQEQLEKLTLEADQESEHAKRQLKTAKRVYKDSVRNLDVLKKMKF